MHIRTFVLLLGILITAVRADVKEQLQSYIQALTSGDTLNVDAKCGTHYNLLIVTNWDQLDPMYQQLYTEKILRQPVRQRSLETAGGHFRLHWDDTGAQAVPPEDLDMNMIPDFIDSAAVIFESVWALEVTQLGYPPPPRQDGDPDSLYDVYFSRMYPLYGATYFNGIDIPSIPGENYASYMELDNDFDGFYSSGLAGLKVTAAHEFHHAIQLGYNVRQSDFFFYEMTSVWMEELAFPEINDYFQYLPSFFNSVSNTSFNNFNNSYANGIFLFMLEELFDRTIVRDMWDEIRSERSLDAIATVLSAPPNNSSWMEILSLFGEWLYYTGERSIPGQYFDEADTYPELRILSSDRIDNQGSYSSSADLPSVANRFFSVGDTINPRLFISTTASGGGDAAVRLLEPGLPGDFYQANEPIVLERLTLAPFGLVLTNAAQVNKSLSLSISTEAGSEIAFGPNPVKPGTGQERVIFQNIPTEADVYIFDIVGRRIAHLPSSDTAVRFWELKNDKGNPVATGVYLVLIRGGGVEKIEKLSILR